MKRLRSAVLPLIVVFVVAGALLVSVWLTGANRRPLRPIVLPSEQAPVSLAPGQSPAAPSAADLPSGLLSAGRETVRTLLATLSRPRSYQVLYRTTWSWPGGNSSPLSAVSADGGLTRVELKTEAGVTERVILTDGEFFCQWKEGGAVYLTSVLGGKTVDNLARLPTYESFLELPDADFASVSFVERGGEALLVVAIRGGLYDGSYEISLDTGLLQKAELLENGSPAYSCELISYVPEPPDEGAFTLPDGMTLAEWLALRRSPPVSPSP